MMDSIKDIELSGDFQSDKIYYLYKTSSSEINLKILSQLQKYESSLDFFSYYTKNDIKNLINSVNQLNKNLTSIFNDNSNSFSTDTNNYISQISKIILTLNFILKIQETLNNLLQKSKQYLNEISCNYKIENIYHDKLSSLIDSLQYNFFSDISSPNNNSSTASTKVNSSTDLYLVNKKPSKKQIEINDDEIQENFFNQKSISIVNEEILSDVQTPSFIDKTSNKDNIYTASNVSDESVSNNNFFNLSFRDMNFIPDSDSKTDDNSPMRKKSINKTEKSYKKNILSFPIDKINNQNSPIKSNLLNNISLDEKGKVKMYGDILILIKKLYKLCLITTEERIEIKKLVISKSKKIIDFYIKEYENIKDDYIKSANAIKKLL